LEISSAPLCNTLSIQTDATSTSSAQLDHLLKQKNGFYAFEGALLVRPSNTSSGVLGVSDWNNESLWRYEYQDLASNLVFYAEDLFGNQFALESGQVVLFDAETGDKEVLAQDINGWAKLILEDNNYRTGYSLGHKWQAKNGALEAGKRLIPKIPFVLGGEYSVENLYALEDEKSMRLRGDLAIQIRDLPDGAQVKYTIVE